MITKNLYDIAIAAGMTEQEFIDEMVRLYVCNLSSTIEENGAQMLVHIVNFSDHDLEITARRVPAKHLSEVN